MIPDALDGWTLDTISGLLNMGAFETDRFDFKEMLPHAHDGQAKERLRKTCAAFANSSGGFLVYGVRVGFGAPEDLMVGIDPTSDFPEHFGNYPAGCEPTVDWQFLNPPLRLSSGRLLHVVFIPRSWRAPHAVASGEAWTFPKRTSKGNEAMSYSEVQQMYLGYYEKRVKLQLLRAELAQVSADAGSMIVPPQENDGTKYGLATIELRVLETVLADTYTVIRERRGLLDTLSAIRSRVRVVNAKIAIFHSKVGLPLSNLHDLVKEHNEWIYPQAVSIIHMAQQAIRELDLIPD